MNDRMSTKELAMIFYNYMVEKSGGNYQLNSKCRTLTNDLDEILSLLPDTNIKEDLDSKIIMLIYETSLHFYHLGFEKALEISRLIYNCGESEI